MANAITSFEGEYRFLSNFYNAPVKYDGMYFLNNEAAFQAAKTTDMVAREAFTTMNPSEAKKAGRRVNLRPDWEDIKGDVMFEVCMDKFSMNPLLKRALLKTGDAHLEEGNTWGDKIWGTVNGVGENRLGKTLMRVREILSEK